ncbi:MAG TPA: hypothetical protein VII41_07190, partial [Steroidobacteraceae bacterium]
MPRRQRPHCVALKRRRGIFECHQQRDIPGHVARQPPCGGIKIALEEYIRDHALQQHHRRHDDDQ